MRDLSLALIYSLSEKITTPSYLITIDWKASGNTLYSTTNRPTVVGGGNTYSSTLTEIDGLTSSEVTLKFVNSYLSPLTSDLIDSSIEIRIAYDTTPLIPADAPIVFQGYLDRASSIDFDFIKIKCYAVPTTYMNTPRAFAAPDVFNHLPPAGTIIGGYILEPAT